MGYLSEVNCKEEIIQLDKSCSLRMSASYLKSYAENIKHICFSLAYAWFKLVNQRSDLAITSNQYISAFLSHFLRDTSLKQLTTHEFVFCAFLAGRIRRFTNLTFARHVNDNKTDFNIEMPEKLEEIAVLHMPKLTVDEIGVVTHAFYHTGILIRTKNVKLKRSLLNFMANVEDSNIIVSQLAISSVAKMLKDRGSVDYDQIKKLMEIYQPLMHTLNKDVTIRFELI